MSRSSSKQSRTWWFGVAAAALALAAVPLAQPSRAHADGTATQAAGPFSGGWELLSFQSASGKFLNVRGAGGSGAQVIIWDTGGNATDNEKWWIEPWSDGSYRLHPLYNQSLCLDVPGGNYNTGTYLQVWSCNGRSNQTFRFQPSGGGARNYIVADWTGSRINKVLDVHSQDNGERVWLWSPNNSGAQHWLTVKYQ
ncbi:RICIN domain-containing protein [Kitasatospora sp. NPDC056138]|uniref:RICIN domain-containing protein n=1 Tax=Kitasatospora sp. NPDC056138 TaxID=3345724 RepID=UPI0035DEBA4B